MRNYKITLHVQKITIKVMFKQELNHDLMQFKFFIYKNDLSMNTPVITTKPNTIRCAYIILEIYI